MASVRSLHHSFIGGEVTPELYGRIDDAKYRSGVARLRNFIALPHGPAQNRSGFAFVREVKASTQKVRLLPFTYSTTQTMVLEFGPAYIRFHTQGATLLTSAGVPYEVATPFTGDDLFQLHYVQSADVLTLVHPNHPPRELRRLGPTNWQLTNVAFAPVMQPPQDLRASAAFTTAADARTTYRYVVTAVAVGGTDETEASAPAQCVGNLNELHAHNTLKWAAVANAGMYRVYKFAGGAFGYIGQTTDLAFTDDNIVADLSMTPPIYESVFNSPGNYPAAVSYFEQRRCFAGTTRQPQNIWMTRSGTESSMAYSLPVRDDDRIAFRVAAREANTIRHIVPLTDLVLLTSAAEWRVTSVNSDAITPSTISVRPQSHVGASDVQPVIINNTMLYPAARGGHVREMAYSWQANGFVTGDLSLRAPHLFDGLDITDMAYAKAPLPIVWSVSSGGKLLGLTYVPEQQVGAWHQHDTSGGVFESCTVVAEGNEDVLYVVVRRTIQKTQRRYIERMMSRQFATAADAFFVDSGVSYTGVPTQNFGGLSHLEGEMVNVLADGIVTAPRMVSGGRITIDEPAGRVHVGLPIVADVQTLPMVAQVDAAYSQGRYKNTNKIWLQVHRSGGIFAGPDADHLTEMKQRTTEPLGSPPVLKTEVLEMNLTPSWGFTGQVFVRQSDPLPLTLVSMTAEVALGG